MARRRCKFFTAAALAKGAKVEKREHHLPIAMATKIARDHLCENPSYYAPKGFAGRGRAQPNLTLTHPYAIALEKIGTAGIGRVTTRAKREYFLRKGLIRPVRGGGYEVTAKGWEVINRTSTGSRSFAGRFGNAKPFVAVAVDHRGIVHGSWPAASVSAAMAAADAGAGKAYSVTVRADRTSDGTVQGPGRGRVEAVREHGRWIRY